MNKIAIWKATWLVCGVLLGPGLVAQEDAKKTTTYVRPTARGFTKECTFAYRADDAGWTITSSTYRGETHLTLTSRYDAKDHLQSATVTFIKGKEKSVAAVEVAKSKAKVLRPGLPTKEFDAPRGVVVTSAPDWTDIWLLCRRYDRKRGGEQTMPGLWIHPTQDPQAIPFRIERTGSDVIEHERKKVTLDRFTIRIRGPNPYVAWADEQGGLVKLAPLPYKEGSAIVREEYAKSTKALEPELP